jgi:hypothetical protein
MDKEKHITKTEVPLRDILIEFCLTKKERQVN